MNIRGICLILSKNKNLLPYIYVIGSEILLLWICFHPIVLCIWLTSLGFMRFITSCTLLTYCSFLECSCRTATTTSIGFSKLWYLWTNPYSGDGSIPAIWGLDCCTLSPIRWPKDWYQYIFSWWLKKPCCSGGNLLNLLSSLKQRDNCVNSSEFLESWRPWMWWDRHAASRKKQQWVAKPTHHAWNGLLKAIVTVLDCFAETPFVDFEPRLTALLSHGPQFEIYLNPFAHKRESYFCYRPVYWRSSYAMVPQFGAVSPIASEIRFNFEILQRVANGTYLYTYPWPQQWVWL